MGACISSNYCSRTRQSSIPNRMQTINNLTTPTSVITQNDEIDIVNNNNNINNNNNTNSNSNNNINHTTTTNNNNNGNNNNTDEALPIPSILNANSNYLLNHINSYNTFSYYVPPTGKNKRLKKDICKYFKCDKKISESQLQAKRDEFWDTAPAFEGKAEIWAALKASVDAYENRNFILAQAIIDSANIILPNGLLSDCYDELGNRYQLPIYVLAKPANLIRKSKSQLVDEEDSTCSSLKNKTNEYDYEDEYDSVSKNFSNNDENSSDEKNIETKKKSTKRKFNLFRLSKNNYDVKATTSKKNRNHEPNKCKNQTNSLKNATHEKIEDKIIPIKLRVSSLNNEDDDIKLDVNLNQTVLSLKTQLFEITNIEPINQRIFFGGKLLRDKERLRVHKLYKNIVLQVIVREIPQIKTTTLES